jgi:alpha-tubulin suppressor-like RCC1 family protein
VYVKPRALHVVATSLVTSLCAFAFFVMTHVSTARAQQITGSTVAVWGGSGNNEISPITGYVRNPLLVRFADNAALSDVVAVAIGQQHTVALSNDGTVWAWGVNQYGQLGDGTTIARPYPARVQFADGSTLTNVVAVAAGDYHTLALRSDGTVWAWGYNWYGQLGDGTNLNFRINPLQVSQAPNGVVLSNVVGVAAGENHSIVLRGDGTVWAWGRSNGWPEGAPDFDTFARPTRPIRLADGSTLTGIVKIAAGSTHGLAVHSDGSVWTWGRNVSGQLGDGTTTNRTFAAPVKLADGSILGGVVAADGGSAHSIALRADGSVATWGLNASGQLGVGTTDASGYPLTVRLVDGSAFSNITAVSAGGHVSMALRADGSIWSWGDGNIAQLGDGSVSGFRTSPGHVLLSQGGFATARAISVGLSAVASIGTFVPVASVTPTALDFGSVAWGSSSAPQSITVANSGTSDLVISSFAPQSTSYYKISPQTTCAAGTVLQPAATCIVAIDFEPLSTGTFLYPLSIVTNAAGSPQVVSLTAVATDPIQLDLPSTSAATEGAPATIAGRVSVTSPHTLVELAADLNADGVFEQFTIPVNADGSFSLDHTYADNGAYTVLIRARDDVNRVVVKAVTVLVSNVAPVVDPIPNQTAHVGSFFQMAGTFSDPGADTWTAAIDYGDGGLDTLVVGPGRTFQSKVPFHQYAREGLYTASVTVSDDEGVTGSKTFTVSAERIPTTTVLFESRTPATSRLGEVVELNFFVNGTTGTSAVTFLDGDTILGSLALDGANTGAIVVGTLRAGTHNLTARYEGSVRSAPSTSPAVTHVVTADRGGLRAWGSGSAGQLGDGAFDTQNAPVAVQRLGDDVVAVAGGMYHTVALKADGTVWAWGLNGNGRLGIGDPSIPFSATPMQVVDLSDIVSIAAGSYHAMALKADGTVWAWGYNGSGQLGTGTYVDQSRPRQVNLPVGVAGIAAGGSHSVALLVDRSVMTWGDNTFGQLGLGVDPAVLPTSAVPTLIAATLLPRQIVAIAAGNFHSLAVNSRQVVAWGYNGQGQLGDGSLTNRSRPVVVPVLANENTVAIAAGGMHSVARLADGTVRTWGDNAWGQLGVFGISNSLSPVNPGLETVAAIAGGGYHSAAIRSDGTIWSWGRDGEGQLGDGPAYSSGFGPVITTTQAVSVGAGTWTGYAIGPVTIASAQPGALSFGRQRFGTTTAPQSVSIANTGSMPLSIRPRIYGGGADYVVTRDECSDVVVAPGSACAIDIVFAPLSVSVPAGLTVSRNATVVVAGNTTSPLSVSMIASAFNDAPPAISIQTPTGAVYALDQVVLADYSCSDAEGPASCVAPVPSGSPIDTATPGPHTFTVTARDTAGNTATSSVAYTVIDLPSIAIVSPTDGIYDLGSAVIAQYSCQNAVTCVGDVPSGSALDTSAPGLKTFSVTATDALGNVTTALAIYNVSLGACVAPMAGLTAWLPGDGSAADRISGAPAAWTGSEEYVAAAAANGFSFSDGSHASLPLDQAGPFTIQAWVRTPQRLDPEFTGVISTGGPGQNDTSLQLELDGAGNYRLNLGDVDVALIGPALDTFQHIAVTFDGVTVSVYVNGQLIQSNLWTGSPAFGFHVLNLGIDRDLAHPFTGTIDEVQIFNRALSETEVAQTFLAGSFGFCKNHPPVAAIGVAPPPVVEATGPLGAMVTLDSASTDSDGDVLTYEWAENGATLGRSSSLSATFAIGAHTVILTVNDAVASTSTSVTFSVTDTTAPIMTVPPDVTVEATSPAGAVVSFSPPTALDAVDGVAPVTCSAASDSTFALGTTTVTCSSSDSRGNGPAQASFHVTVQDTTAPFVTVPADMVVEAASAAGEMVTFTVTASDRVDGGALTASCSPASMSVFGLGTTTVTCSSTDSHGNVGSASFRVTVQDTTPPVVTVPPDITAEATSASGAVVTFAASGTDLVDGSIPVTCAPASGSLFGLGQTTVRCSASDSQRNGPAIASFTVTVVDTSGPALTLPGDVIAEAASPLGAAVAFTVSATDAVSGLASIACAPASGTGFAIGTTTVSCGATDGAGNHTTGSFNVLVRDSLPPTAQVTSPSIDAALSGSPVDVVVQATDSVGVAGVTVNGVAAISIGGSPQSGVWRATVPVTLPVAAGGVLRFDAVASDGAGNNRPATLLVDNDGIPKTMDRGRTSGADQSNAFSNDFNNDVTAGTMARNGWTAKLSSVAPGGTVQTTISGSAIGPAVISACVGVAKEVRLDVAGETANISCNPATGTITVRAVSAVTRIELREQLAGGTWQQFSLPTGQMMSVGSPATADPANTETIEAQILQIDDAGNETVVGAYQLTPGASVDVSAATDAAGTVGIQFDVVSGTVTTTVGGDTRTVAQGETVTLPVTGPLKTAPIVTWAAPAGIVYGTALSATQLNATANVPGTFVYHPAAGTVLAAGVSRALSVAFTPTDSVHYQSATAAVSIAVAQATPTITWNAPAAIAVGTALTAAQLNATANVPGTFVYTPALGTVLPAGAAQTLSVDFTPTDSANYTKATKSVTITVFASAVSTTDVSITEGNSTGATRQVLIPVRLAAKSSEWIAVSYTTADGTAKRDADYFATSDTVWFAPGVVAQSAAIPIVQDTVGEATEAFFVDFTAVINGAPSQARATVTIVNDDSTAQVFTSSDDFAAGTLANGAYAAETDDGELTLAPRGSEFSGPSLPDGSTSALLAPNGSIVVANGKLAVNGASVTLPADSAAGPTLEFAAVFTRSPEQRAGFAAGGSGPSLAVFVVKSDGELYARSVNGARVVESPMAGIDWLAKSHRYKIVWTTGGAQYFVDGTLMITHSSMAWGSATMQPAVVDPIAGDGALTIDWLRATPYAAAGSYTSAVFDAGAAVLWQKLTATSSVPSGTMATFTYRTGNTPVPDASWTSFTAPALGGTVTGSSRYMQFAIQLGSTVVTRTPVVQDVTVQFKR